MVKTYDWLITAKKALVVAAAGGVVSLIAYFQNFVPVDATSSLVVSLVLSILAAANNWLKHRND